VETTAKDESDGGPWDGSCTSHLPDRSEIGPWCERTYMKSTSESLSHPETSNGKAAEGNCVVVRRGGEQPEADLRSQTKVNPIRFTTAASLLGTGEACRMSGNRFPLHPSFMREERALVDGWGENAGKVSCGSVESCPGRNPRERGRAAVSLPAVALAKAGSRHSSASNPREIQRRSDRDRGAKPGNDRWSGWRKRD
jgi:hypothetical protein